MLDRPSRPRATAGSRPRAGAAATLTLAEQLTGVGVTEGWLLREHDATIIRRQSSQR